MAWSRGTICGDQGGLCLHLYHTLLAIFSPPDLVSVAPDVATRRQLCFDCVWAHVRSVLAGVPGGQAHFGAFLRDRAAALHAV